MRKSNRSKVSTTTVKKEIIEIEERMRKPRRSKVSTTTVKKEIIEFEERVRKPSSSKVSTKTVKKEIIEIEERTRKPSSSKVITPATKNEIIEIIEIESDEEVDDRALALCGEVNEAEIGETSKTGMEIVCADDCDSGLVYDLEYKKYLAGCNEINLYLPEMDNSPLPLMYAVDNEATDRSLRKSRAVKSDKIRSRRRRSQSPLISSVSKRVKTEKVDARPRRNTALTKNAIKLEPKSDAKDTQQKKNTVKLEPRTRSKVKDAQQKEEDARRGRKIPLTKNDFKACKKENDEKSQTIFRASKRLKTESEREDHNTVSRTIPVVITKGKKGEALRERKIHVTRKMVKSKFTSDSKDTKQKKGEALRGRKITVTKRNVKSKSTSDTKDNLHSSKVFKKASEETLSSVDKSYEYFLEHLRNSISIFEPNQKVKPVEDSVCLFDPDIIAISDYPFSDGGKSPFQANKDGKVIDVEEGIEPDNIFNSSFSKKLMEVLRKPYDKKEFVDCYHQASHKRPLTRYRQLRNGNEIEYSVHDQLTHSYLQEYPDFKKKLRRHQKDLHRALNLLRGFLFYLENIILEGAFKPWKYEKLIMKNAKILYAPSDAAPESS